MSAAPPARSVFAGRAGSSQRAVTVLTDSGYRFDAPSPERRVVLDTFDGRVHAAGLRCEHRCCAGHGELVLTGADTAPVDFPCAGPPPRFATDLPPGPLADDLAALTGGRALLPVGSITATTRRGRLVDSAGRTTGAATVFDDLAVEGAPGAPVPAWTVELAGGAGAEAHPCTAGDALARDGHDRLDGDTVDVALAAAGVDVAGYTGPADVAIDASMPALDGARAVLAALAETIDANWQGAIEDIDPEFLHDLRIGVRRTRAIIRALRPALPGHLGTLARERFAWLGQVTGPARDLDVHASAWPGGAGGRDDAAVLEPARAVLEANRARAHVELATMLRSAEAVHWMRTWQAWLAEPAADEDPGPAADRPLGHVVADRIRRDHRRLVRDGRAIDASTPSDAVHELRKDAKKLRYVVEAFGDLMPRRRRKAYVRRLKALQDNLGAHQDAVVQADRLRQIAVELDASGGAAGAARAALAPLLDELDRRRQDARDEFASVFASFDAKKTRRALRRALKRLAR